jgi:cytochrome c
MSRLNAVCACAVLAFASGIACAGDAARGQTLYDSRCGACHSIDANRVGPAHQGVFGRKAGSARDYEYSNALKASKIVWNEKTLGEWLANPEKADTGPAHGLLGSEPADRADLIAYLKKESGR